MHPLRLDFKSRQPATSLPLGWMILALGLLAAGAAFHDFRQTQEYAEKLEARLGARQPAAPRKSESFGLATQALAIPWSNLFHSLEAARMKNVSIDTVEPDPKEGRITIAANAASMTDITSYWNALGNAGFQDVALTEHQHPTDGSRGILFKVNAKWPTTHR